MIPLTVGDDLMVDIRLGLDNQTALRRLFWKVCRPIIHIHNIHNIHDILKW